MSVTDTPQSPTLNNTEQTEQSHKNYECDDENHLCDNARFLLSDTPDIEVPGRHGYRIPT